MTASCPTISLNDVTNLYLIHKGSDTRKFFKPTLILAEEVFKEIFQQTLFVVKSEYVELKKGEPYNYVDVPRNLQRFLSLSVEDKCHNLKPLYYNGELNVLVKPKKKTCGCKDKDCGCSALCDAVGGLTVTTKDVIINDQSFTESRWIKICPDGCVYEYRTIPTTKYTFDLGSYDNSYDVSYEVGSSETEVVTYTLSRILTTLDVEACGCPKQTKENEEKFFRHCGCFLNSCNRVKKQCEKYWGECNYFAGEIKFSECGTKLFVKHVENFKHNQWMVLSYQINGVEPDSQVQVPDYAKMTMYSGIDYHRAVFNDRYSQSEKMTKYYKYEDEKQKLILYNNMIDITWAERESNKVARW